MALLGTVSSNRCICLNATHNMLSWSQSRDVQICTNAETNSDTEHPTLNLVWVLVKALRLSR